MKNFTKYSRRLYRWIVDLILPPCCVVCGKVETWLCDTCVQEIPLLRNPVCSSCGQPWHGEGLCPGCRATPLSVARLRSAFIFGGAVQHAIHALKYRGGKSVVQPLATAMLQAWQYYHMHSDLLIPVPLHPHREMQRGYNQSALLAKALSQHIDIPVAPHALVRVRNTKSQTKLKRLERQQNMKDAFSCEQDSVKSKKITLVDDVATTGATLNACAVALLARGAKSVNAFTLARTYHPNT